MISLTDPNRFMVSQPYQVERGTTNETPSALLNNTLSK